MGLRQLRDIPRLILLAIVLAGIPTLAARAQEIPGPPGLVEELNVLGLHLYRSEDFDTAIEVLSRAISLRPENPVAYNHRSLARAARGDYDGALADAQQTIDQLSATQLATADDWAAVYDTRAYAYLLLGRWEDALADYDAALTVTINTQPAYTLGRGLTLLGLGDQQQGVNNLKWGTLIGGASPADPQLEDIRQRVQTALREIMPETDPDRFGPDDSSQLANSLSLDGLPQFHSLQAGDNDWVSFDLEAGQRVFLVTSSEGCDTQLTLYGPDGRTVLREDDDGGLFQNAELDYPIREGGTYFARVRHFFATEGTCEAYQISAQVVGP